SARPHEFVLLRTQPTPWTPLDCLGLLKLMSWNLASNWDVELARLKVLLDDGPDALKAIDPGSDPECLVTAPVGSKAGLAVDRLAEDLAQFADLLGPAA